MNASNPLPQVNQYLRKHQLMPLQIEACPAPDLNCVVVIPCRDEPDVLETLISLSACNTPNCCVEILLVINSAADASAEERSQNIRSAAQARQFAQSEHCPQWLRVWVLEFANLEPQQAGVGLARRLGMDEAVARLDRVAAQNGIIVGLDADCRVASNYFEALLEHFHTQPKTNACSIYYEHPLSGGAAPEVYRAITEYELYLRYFRRGLVTARYPYAYHTVGSCMAVRSRAYQSCGGMNKRQAAEDFHFLSKLMLQGGYSDLFTTTVFPAARPSHRVPFGTGHAVAKRLREPSLLVYAPEVFEAIGELVCAVESWAQQGTVELRKISTQYFNALGLEDRLKEIRQHTASAQGFSKRLYRWLNPLCIVKYANYLSSVHYPRIPILDAAQRLLDNTAPVELPDSDKVSWLLAQYRGLERP